MRLLCCTDDSPPSVLAFSCLFASVGDGVLRAWLAQRNTQGVDAGEPALAAAAQVGLGEGRGMAKVLWPRWRRLTVVA